MVSDCCFEGLADACYSSWNCVRETTISACRWIYANILCPPCICNQQSTQNRVKSASPKPKIRSNESTPLASPPNKMFKGQQSPDRASKEIKETTMPQPSLTTPMQQSPQQSVEHSQQPDDAKPIGSHPNIPEISNTDSTIKTTTEKQSETLHTTSKRVEDQAIPRPIKPSSQATSKETSSLTGSKDLSYISQVSESPRPRPSPPKIDFVETGSIFGDRKRHSQHANLLLMDNGRFKSPGRPNILPGPGGRTIRISFQTGFPSIKSIESRAPPASVRSKISTRSEESAVRETRETSSLSEINPDVPKKAFAKKKKKTRKSAMSRKSMKSVISKGPIMEMEVERDEDSSPEINSEEPVVKSIESQGKSPK